MAKVIEEVVIEALEKLGPKVGDWGLEFNEQLLWLPSPAPTPQVQYEDIGELEGYPDKEKNLRHLFQAAKQLQGKQQQRSSPSFSKGCAFSSGPDTSTLQRKLLLEPASQTGKRLPRGKVSF